MWECDTVYSGSSRESMGSREVVILLLAPECMFDEIVALKPTGHWRRQMTTLIWKFGVFHKLSPDVFTFENSMVGVLTSFPGNRLRDKTLITRF